MRRGRICRGLYSPNTPSIIFILSFSVCGAHYDNNSFHWIDEKPQLQPVKYLLAWFDDKVNVSPVLNIYERPIFILNVVETILIWLFEVKY